MVRYYSDMRHKTNTLMSLYYFYKNIKNSRELIVQLFTRDFTSSVRKSFLGVGWVLLSPLLGVFSWLIMNEIGALNPGQNDIPYPVFLLMSTLIWNAFVQSFETTSTTLQSGAGFILQVNYPHEIMIVKQYLHFFANYLISFIITTAVLVVFNYDMSWAIILLPILILPLTMLGVGLGVIISLVSVVIPDIKRITSYFIKTLMFITPVIYVPKTNNKFLEMLIELNPLNHIITGIRELCLNGNINLSNQFTISCIFCLLVLVIGLRVFYLGEHKVIEKML